MSFWREAADGVTVMVKVRPRSRRPGVHGVQESAAGPRLQVAVTEAAEDGKANRAVCALLADILHRPQSAVQIVSGATSREKLLSVTGDSAILVDTLRAL
ncbi:MAG: DUF167 family protein [Acetobacteraceae bacterium]|jgi:uncharacterized protein (TIGR00251 family)